MFPNKRDNLNKKVKKRIKGKHFDNDVVEINWNYWRGALFCDDGSTTHTRQRKLKISQMESY